MNYDLQAYLQKDDGTSAAVNTKTLFPGMYVLEAKGLADYGKAKNIVTESYADGAGLRSYIPDGTIFREATDVTLKLCFFSEGGTDRYVQFDNFIAYMEGDIVWYWDSVRKRKARLLLVEKTSPSEHFKGQLEYIEAEVKFKNVDGYSIQLAKWSATWTDPVCVKVDGLNNGKARYTGVTLTDGTNEEEYSILDDFGSYAVVTTSEYAALSETDFQARLSAFASFVLSAMSEVYIDFADDMPSIPTDGVEVTNQTLCPLQ